MPVRSYQHLADRTSDAVARQKSVALLKELAEIDPVNPTLTAVRQEAVDMLEKTSSPSSKQ
jgi:hypothetical protein